MKNGKNYDINFIEGSLVLKWEILGFGFGRKVAHKILFEAKNLSEE